MSGPASTAVGAYNKVNDWMSGMSDIVDEIMRPLVEPLADQLECVTGDPETLKEAAKLWRDKAADLRDVVADQRRDRADLAHEWTGEAAEAFQNNLAELETAMEAEAHDMDETANVLDQAADQAQMAQEMVEAVIRELIEWALITLAAAVALTVVTAGLSWAAETAAAATEASIATSRIASLVNRLAKELKALANILKMLKQAKKLSKVKKWKPWTWKHLKDAGEAEKFAIAYGAKKAHKAIKHGAKGVMGGLGFTGNPVGAAAGVAINHGVDAAAEKIDEVLTGDKSSSDDGASSRSGHRDVHLPPASDFAGPPTAYDPPVTGHPIDQTPVAQDPLSRYREPAVEQDPRPVAQDPLNRYREPAVEQDPRLVARPAVAQQPRDPDNPFG
ncbi:WXG100 family type VII secretion target [Streptomyces sioyaensis]|uniref:WXG100 family type VII secretion target n=1 Tax=Streptomyces sioyaensis TaxID=67364 RepID=UPI0037136FB5